MEITKTDGGWIKGSEERAEDRAEIRAEDRTEGRVEEEGPSSPVHDFRAASPDTQFIPDTEAGPSEFTRMPTPVYQPESRAPHSEHLIQSSDWLTIRSSLFLNVWLLCCLASRVVLLLHLELPLLIRPLLPTSPLCFR